MKIYDIIIIGAGPSGMMAAIRAAHSKKKVLLIEKNERLGQKLLISGKGRCNVTNSGELDNFLDNFSKTGEFLRDSFKEFFNNDLMKFFENKGLRLKVERGRRVFPTSDEAGSVLNILKKYLQKSKVNILYNDKVVYVGKNNQFRVKLDSGKVINSKQLIIATGGLSYPLTGSSGDGFSFAKNLGHKIVDLRPGLVSLEIEKRRIAKELQGLSLKNVRVKFLQGRKSVESEIGEMLFTHFGVSGPLILELSGKVIDWFNDSRESIKLSIDLKPGLTKEQLENRLIRDFKSQGAKNFKNVLAGLLPRKMIEVFIKLSGVSQDKKVNQVTAEDRRRIRDLLKNLTLIISKPRPIKEAIITRGGIPTKEIDPRTMQSRLVKELYFCGEIIDVDASTGGYNLQAAFSTGYLAGESAGKGV